MFEMKSLKLVFVMVSEANGKGICPILVPWSSWGQIFMPSPNHIPHLRTLIGSRPKSSYLNAGRAQTLVPNCSHGPNPGTLFSIEEATGQSMSTSSTPDQVKARLPSSNHTSHHRIPIQAGPKVSYPTPAMVQMLLP